MVSNTKEKCAKSVSVCVYARARVLAWERTVMKWVQKKKTRRRGKVYFTGSRKNPGCVFGLFGQRRPRSASFAFPAVTSRRASSVRLGGGGRRRMTRVSGSTEACRRRRPNSHALVFVVSVVIILL